MTEFFHMGGYGLYIWAVVGASLAGLIGLYGLSVKAHNSFDDEGEE